jgi:hypothetical protein
MNKIISSLAVTVTLVSVSSNAGYQHGWKVYDKPQPGYTYGGVEVNPYGPGGSRSIAPGDGKSLMNPWRRKN